jgi:FlaA1/EpsC-like NDP-sugar epimerase
VVRRAVQASLDVLAWVFAIGAATWIRFDFMWSSVHHRSVFLAGLGAGIVQVLSGIVLRLYQGRYVYGSFEQVLVLSVSAAITTTIAAGIDWARPGRGVPVSSVILAGAGALLAMLAVRYVVRAYRESRRRPADDARPALVFGAGSAGEQLVRRLQVDPHSEFRVVGLIDDSSSKRRLRIAGVPVLGTRRELAEIAERTGAELVIISVADPDPHVVQDIAHRAAAAGLAVKTIPRLVELTDGVVGPADVRDLTVTDLLRRPPVTTDLRDVRGLVEGKRVLITGAGGSIGSELSRQVFRFRPSALGLLDRDESSLHALELSMRGRALLDDDTTILADIRDLEGLVRVFTDFKPDVVFHAAALKHLPMLQRFPDEAVKTNITGTLNVLQAATSVGVPLFVNISTDKAADPSSVLGYSKRITERLTAGVAAYNPGDYVSVRFGNVLGSRGSVLTSFQDQIHRGGPVTVTHPDVSRFFMTIPEAVQLVLQAAATGTDGDVLVLDMGEPVRIADVARQLIEHSGREIDIVYTGLRDGEKLDEVLFGRGEDRHETTNPLVSRVSVPALFPDDLDVLDTVHTDAQLVALLRNLCRTGRSGVPSAGQVRS